MPEASSDHSHERPHKQSEPGTRTLIIATAGHVDHGKTSLVNQLTGTDTDTLAEEKERGLTIVPGYAYHHFSSELGGEVFENTLGFVDVPGHTDFINNMLAGVSAVDAAMLVIAADDGIMPQTREHLAILDLLGIELGLIALSKIDRCEPQRIESVSADIRKLTSSSTLHGAPIFPISNLTGQGIAALTDHLHAMFAAKQEDGSADNEEYFRYLIDRSFTVKGVGTVLTGSVRAGRARDGETFKHTGSGEPAKIKGLRLDNATLKAVGKGQRAAINTSLDHKLVARGDWLVDEAIFYPVHRFDASIDFIVENFKLRSNAQYHLHIGASHHVVNIRCLGGVENHLHQIKSNEPVIAHQGDRFIIRDPASQNTIGGGKVIDIFVPRRNRSSESRIASLEALHQDSLAALGELLELLPDGVDTRQFAIARNITDAGIHGLIEVLTSKHLGFVSLHIEKQVLPIILHEKYISQYSQQLLSQINTFHDQHSNQQGISEPALSKAVDFTGSHILFHSILQTLIDDEAIKRTGTLLHLPDHQTALSQEEQDFLAKVRPILLKAGNVAPRTRELVDFTGIPLKPLERVLRLSTKAGTLVQVAVNRHYLPETIMTLAEFTEQLARESNSDEGFSVIQFRDTSGIGRNLCIEILEYFDKVGFTRRDGNTRFVRTEKENIFGK